MVARDLKSNTFQGMSSSAIDFNGEVIRKNKGFKKGSLPNNEAPLLVMSITKKNKNGDYCGVYTGIKTQDGQTENDPTDAPRRNSCGKGKGKVYKNKENRSKHRKNKSTPKEEQDLIEMAIRESKVATAMLQKHY